MNQLKDKVALVTGASKGIGAEIARSMAAAGACVVVNYASSKAGADHVVGEIIANGGRAIAVRGDVSIAADVDHMVSQAIDAFGSLDILVNNAAYFTFGPLEGIEEDEFHKHFNINVLGTILTTQAAVKHFKAGGCVINIGSAGILTPLPNATLYSATKAALNMITRVLANELGPRQIRVNAICPGTTETEGNPIGTMDDAVRRQMVAKTALGRIGHPADIAPAVVFLASEAAGWITGEIIHVSGGFR